MDCEQKGKKEKIKIIIKKPHITLFFASSTGVSDKLFSISVTLETGLIA
jgi:hypothetical protein